MSFFNEDVLCKSEGTDDPDLTPEEVAEMEAAYALPWLCGSCGEDLSAYPLVECEHPWCHGDDVYK